MTKITITKDEETMNEKTMTKDEFFNYGKYGGNGYFKRKCFVNDMNG